MACNSFTPGCGCEKCDLIRKFWAYRNVDESMIGASPFYPLAYSEYDFDFIRKNNKVTLAMAVDNLANLSVNTDYGEPIDKADVELTIPPDQAIEEIQRKMANE